jgi:uncharacterized protein YcsI (UPF0317 family)
VITGFSEIRSYSSQAARTAIRNGLYARHTAGLAPGYLQANLVILSERYALDFMRFCQRNPKPCPLVGATDTGDPLFRTLGFDVDIRSDLPSYNIYRNGRLDEQIVDVGARWSDDLVGFALGCSFTFENALLKHGIPLWHIDNDATVPMFRTNIPLVPAGPFRGNMVASMRAIPNERVREAISVSARYPLAHGAPVHVGDPAAIGINDTGTPDWGDPAPLEAGYTPCFWACGVTPQAAVLSAGLPFVITHTPGHMLITDVPEDADVPVLGEFEFEV